MAAPSAKGLAKQQTLQFKHNFNVSNPGSIDDHYKMDRKVLGEGSYGQVCKGVAKCALEGCQQTERAIKSIDISKISDHSRFEEEVAIQKNLDHPHIVKLYEVFKDAKRMYLVMELCTGGELFDRIVEEAEKNADLGADGQAFDERGAATYMKQILGAMRYLHSQSFVHRDIKPENFLLQDKTRNAAIKVIDFGLAKKFEPGMPMKTKAGTPYYVAPQVLQGSYDEKCDIWSCGVICYILLCGYPPFFGDSDEQILKAVKAGKFDFPSPDWDSITVQGKDMIGLMLKMDPKERKSAEQLVDHVWLSVNADKPTGKVEQDLAKNLKKFSTVSKLKKVALTVVAQQLQEKDIAEMRNTFNLLDNNGDGTLTVAEIQEGMKKHNVKLPPDLENTLRALDTDGSGSIDYTEFIAATLATKLYTKKEHLWTAFRTFDKDGDGSITKSELRMILSGNADEEISKADKELEKQIEQMMKETDLDGDGQISFDEFCKMMESTDKAS